MRRYSIVVMGSSSGGLDALGKILSALPGDLPIPVVVAQHRAPESSDLALTDYYDRRCELAVGSILDKQPIESGHVYLAPPDYHVYVEEESFSLSVDERVSFSRPSIDVLFESAADSFGERTIGVILTGANDDGALGLSQVREVGGFTIVQDPQTAASPIMPAAAIARKSPHAVLALDEIALYLVKLAAEES